MVGTHNASISVNPLSNLFFIFNCTTSSCCTSLSLVCPNVLIITFSLLIVFNCNLVLTFSEIYDRWLPLSNKILVQFLTSVVSAGHMSAIAVCKRIPLFSHPVWPTNPLLSLLCLPSLLSLFPVPLGSIFLPSEPDSHIEM